MKKTIARAGRAILVAAVAIAFTACDDGQLRKEAVEFSISPASPIIVSFYADPVEVPEGGQTTITWEVAGADTIEITSVATDGSSPLHVESSETKGTAVAKDLKANTDFTITATLKNPPVPEAEKPAEGEEAKKAISISARLKSEAAEGTPEGEDAASGGATAAPPATETITVKVVKESGVEAEISADKGSLNPGEGTIIRWKVSPAEAVVEVTDSDDVAVGPTFSGKDCEATDPAVLLDTGTLTEKPAAEGCAAVTPDKTTVYTVTGTAGGKTGSAEVEVKVAENGLKAEILINGEKNPVAANFADPVKVSWIAEPAGALVTITANPAVASCTPELPQGQVVDYVSADCTLAGPTDFTIRVALAENSDDFAEDNASIGRGSVTAGIDIRADEWAFEGEEVVIEVTPKTGVDATAIKEVRVSDASQADGIRRVTVLTAEPIRVIVPHDGVTVEMEDVAGEVYPYGTRVRALATIDEVVADKAEAVTSLSFDPNDAKTRFAGVQMTGWNKGVARIYKNGGEIDVNFGDLLKAANGLGKYWANDEKLDKALKTFPVNAVSVRPGKSTEIYVGVTGAVMVSDDSGSSFSLLAPARRISIDGKDYDGSHPTCRGQTQTGVKASHKNQLVSLNQICDIEITASGRFIAATDNGTFTISNIDAFRAKEEGVVVVGHPSGNGKADEEGYLTYGHVVDDVQCLDVDCARVLAATDVGVVVSENGGETWAEFGSIGATAYKLVHLGDKVYAATDSGVYESDAASASWTKIGLDRAVKSVAIDPSEGQFGRMIIAGTEEGVFVTRDSGANWSPISSAGADPSRNVAIASTNSASGAGKVVTVMLGSGKKVIYGQTVVGILPPEATKAEVAEAMLSAGVSPALVDDYEGLQQRK